MSIRFRRWLYLFFILAFLIITPLIIIYATGSRIGLRGLVRGRLNIEKTGALIIDTEPEGADIYLNNRLRQNWWKTYLSPQQSTIVTAAKIKDLSPGDYELRLEKEGYWTWQKRLTIWPGLATYAEHIVLFKNNLPMLIANGELSGLSPSPNAKFLFAAANPSIIYDLGADKKIPIANGSSTIPGFNGLTPTLSWSPDSNYFIFDKNLVAISEPLRPKDLDTIIKASSTLVKWDINNSRRMYYLSGEAISQINLDDLSTTTLLKNSRLTDFLVKEDTISTVAAISQGGIFSTRTLNGSNILASIKLPDAAFEFINPNHKLINILGQKTGTLYLIDPYRPIDPLVDTIENVSKAKWVNDNLLLYASGLEIWLYDLTSHKSTLLTRLSQTITDIFWHPSNNYVIYTTTDAVSVIELDDRAKRNITVLTRLSEIEWPILSSDGSTLYFFGRIGSQEGLYKLELQ
jgi:hypothetical protein